MIKALPPSGSQGVVCDVLQHVDCHHFATLFNLMMLIW